MTFSGDLTLAIVGADDLDQPTRAEIVALCESAYNESFAHLFEQLPDSVHLLARDRDGRLVSHAAWVTRWLQPAGLAHLRTAYVEAVATAPDQQRRGFATTVLRAVADILAAQPEWDLAALSPSYSAFYARLGWELWRGPLAIRRGDAIEPTPAGEEVMILRLPRTSVTLDPSVLLTAEWREGELW